MYSWQSLLTVVKTNIFYPLLHCVSEEAALVLGRDADLLDRIMEWCEAKDHAGVRGEASRLLAALIRHSQNSVSQILLLGMFLCLSSNLFVLVIELALSDVHLLSCDRLIFSL